MNKQLLVFAFCLLSLVFPSSAQVSLIPKVGMSFGTYQVNKVEDSEYVVGFAAGLGIQLPIPQNPIFSFQPEVNYIQKGTHYRKTDTPTNTPVDLPLQVESRNRLNYLEIPLLAKVTLGKGALKYYFMAGPSIGIALGGNYRSQLTNTSQTLIEQEGKIRFKQKPAHYTGQDAFFYPAGYNRLDVGIQIGTGIGLQVGNGMLLAEARYGRGLTYLLKHHIMYIRETHPDFGEIKVEFDRPADMKSRTFVISLGYMIAFGKIN
ncbi:porin family protein [Rhodocytophaga aerolata]|uniref:Porin family protein n=1 Tax=Rhodocytophaga aerolata TaxID=455078 RepID=A0ABT8RCE7_9BACT|nr:porin family protein [Rhodocytophaga aerolata]MDO1449777.1 porin family protein [Rhodocytophaga aerolata]